MADVEKGKNPENISWQAPTENVDGSPINGPLSYKIYRKDSDADVFPAVEFYVIVGTLQTDGSYQAPLENFPEGRHVVALTAIDADGDESAHSNTVGFTIGVAPRAPVLLP